ncbi:hypothetical protein GTQ40_10065 [Flavobacteriaceae bacterium R38]|nr:hypothetical protein [Flavobacteriaceae bacterium R38]
MTSNLRRRHLFMWIGILVILPVLMILAIINIPKFPVNDQLVEIASSNKGAVLKTAITDNVELKLIEAASKKILEIQILQPLKASSATVHILNDDLSKGDFIGQISAKGIYKFPIEKEINGISIFDHIKGEEITKIQF